MCVQGTGCGTDLPANTGGDAGLHFDVVLDKWWRNDDTHEFHICYPIDGLLSSIPAGEYRLTLRVEGGDQSVVKSFRVNKEWLEEERWHKRLTMEATP